MVFHAGTFCASLGTERRRCTAASTCPSAESCLSCRARSYGRRSFLGRGAENARTKRSTLGVRLANIKGPWVTKMYYVASTSLQHHHALSSLRSTRLAASPIINNDMNATPTAIGFFKCADNGTLYETYTRSSEIGPKYSTTSTYIYHGSVLVSQVFVRQRDSRTSRRIQEAHMCRDRTRQRRERCHNVNVTVKLILSLLSFTQNQNAYVAPSGRIILTSASSTTDPGMCVMTGTPTMCL